MTGRQVIAAVVAIVLATAVLPPAAAWMVNERRIARAERDVAALVQRFHAASGDPLPAGVPSRVICGTGERPDGIAAEVRVWDFNPPVSADPWGNCYLLQLTMPGDRPAVRVISAGPNGTIETPLVGAAQPGGDDIAQFF